MDNILPGFAVIIGIGIFLLVIEKIKKWINCRLFNDMNCNKEDLPVDFREDEYRYTNEKNKQSQN